MAYFLRGVCFYSIGEKEEAISDLERALDQGLPTEIQEIANEILDELGQ